MTIETFKTKKMRVRATVLSLGVAAVAAGIALVVPLAATAGASSHAVTLTAGPYADQQSISVSVAANSTFTPGAGIKILECSDPGGSAANLPTSASTCDGNTIQGSTVIVKSDGSISVPAYTLFQLPNTALSEPAGSKPACDTTNYCVLYVGQNQNDFTKPFLFSAPFVFGGVAPPTTTTTAPPVGGQSEWTVSQLGTVYTGGSAVNFGDLTGVALAKPIVGITPTPTSKGYWLVASDGGIFSYGDAKFFGSTGAIALNKPIVGIATTPDGNGYWLVASDGGIFSFGDAAFYGSTGNIALNKPVVGFVATPDGKGYWFVASDGGIFSEGDAGFFGSHGGSALTAPIVGLESTGTGKGYWFAGADGIVYPFGDAQAIGSVTTAIASPIVGIG